MLHPRCFPTFRLLFAALIAALLIGGCARAPVFIPANQRRAIDRKYAEYPAGVVLKEVVRGLTAPVDCEIDPKGNLLVVESGAGGFEPHIYGFHRDGSLFTVYPAGRTIPIVGPLNAIKTGFRIFGPIGGMVLENGKIYVSHRDAQGFGMITAFGYDGSHTTIVAGMPAQGDYGMSDLAIAPNGRLWFGVGSATNSGVVGLENWIWVKRHPEFCDRSWVDLKLNGFHFKSKNPDAGLFGPPDLAVTAPFQPFNVSTQTRIRKNDRPTGALYSIDPNGGSVRVEAHGIHCPRGLAWAEYPTLYFTNDGMELRGTRPVQDDPDTLLKYVPGTWYGWPDYSTDLQPITNEKFQPLDKQMMARSGYAEISYLLDHNASNNTEGLIAPARSTLLQAVFPSLAGAANFDFVGGEGPLKRFRGNAIVPLSGDRAPFSTGGSKRFMGPVGFKVVRVDPSTREVEDFVRNTKGAPASRLGEGEGVLERPVAVKFAPDGRMYIVDFGRADYRINGRVKVKPRTGKIFVLEPLAATTAPTASAAQPAADTTQPSP